MPAVAVLDMGKSNVKLSAASHDGHVFETLSTTNTVLDGPPWRHQDLQGLCEWVGQGLSTLCRRHDIGHVIAVGYGSGGVLVGDDPAASDGGAVLPMIDYEQPLPDGLNDDYLPMAGTFYDRGSAVMMASTHQARQLFWMARSEPQAVAAARWYLGLPQYWAWWLSGVAVSEPSHLGAQSHLWNVVEQRFSPIVHAQGWMRLMAPMGRAWQDLGPLRPALVQRFGLPSGIRVHAGAHDSSANFYRYQAAGQHHFEVVSTGTWIVAMGDDVPLSRLDEDRSMALNSDVFGQPAGGALVMGGREFSLVAGAQQGGATSSADTIARLISRGTFALPAFGASSGQFAGSAGRGRIHGPTADDADERLALAVLYLALLTANCAAALGDRPIILDGSYLQDPNFAALVHAFRGAGCTQYNPETYGVAAGAALLCFHEASSAPATVTLLPPPDVFDMAGAQAYVRRWHELTYTNLQRMNT